jgi:hypothetical protein
MHRLTAEDDRRYLGETMGLDETQIRFATRLQTGEALAYSDEFAETTHITITPELGATSPGLVPPAAAVPFAACEHCRARCAYRGAGLAMVCDPVTVSGIMDAVAGLEVDGLTAAEIEHRWTGLLDRLLGCVGSFPALPTTEAGKKDAAYCLFLHALAVRTMRFSPAWTTAMAARLGITQPAATGAGDDSATTTDLEKARAGNTP